MGNIDILIFLQVVGLAFLFDNQARANDLWTKKNYKSLFSLFLFSFLPTITILSL